MTHLIQTLGLRRIGNAVPAGQAVDSAIIDTRDMEGIAFVVLLGAVADGAILSLVAKQSATEDASAMEVIGATPPIGVANGSHRIIVLEVFKPKQRYVMAELTRAGDAAVDGIFAITYGAIPALDPTVISAAYIECAV